MLSTRLTGSSTTSVVVSKRSTWSMKVSASGCAKAFATRLAVTSGR